MAWIRISVPYLFARLLFIIAVIADNFLKLLEAAADSTAAALNGRHLVVAFTKTTPAQVKIIKNAAGRILDLSGVIPSMLEWLSLEYNFTWSPLESKKTIVIIDLANGTSREQLRHYLENGMCDLVVGTLAPIYSLFEQLDFLCGHLDGSSALIIPKPRPAHQNVHAIVKPFQSWVWVCLFLGITITLAAVYLINRSLKNKS